MLTLSSLEIEGFRSFKDKAVIDFPSHGAVLVSGKYRDSTLSSGSGKSSVLLAISFALGICKLPATELKNWDSKKLSVRLTLADGNNKYVIIRDPKLSLVINGEPYTGLSKGADEKLEEILQIKPEIADALVNRAQRVQGKFINATDAAKKEFLTPLLKLDQLEKASEDLALETNFVTNETATTEREIAVLKEVIDQNNVTEHMVLEAAIKHNDLSDQVDNMLSDSELKEVQQKGKQVDEEIIRIGNDCRRIDSIKRDNEDIKYTVVSLQKEIDVLSHKTCFTCKREWSGATIELNSKEEQKNRLLETFQSNLSQLKQLESLVLAQASLLSEREKLQQLLAEKRAPLNSLKEAYHSASVYHSNIQHTYNSFLANKKKLDTLLNKIVGLQEKKVSLETASTIIGRNGFLGSIFDEILIEIETKINQMMAMIPNVNTFTVSIASTTVTKTGNSKKTISTTIYKDGKEISIKSLSGGQMCSLELCADLAVRETICSRSGINLGWIALDEAMDGMDADSKKAALDMIKMKVNGLVIIVEHTTEVKEGFEKVIEVEYDGRYSHVN